MTNLLFYISTILIWGSTWLGIQYQVNGTSIVWSVAYRFALASAILFLYCFATRASLKFNRQEHMAIFLQSLMMFSVNYILIYMGSEHLISGYVAIAGATIAIINILNARLFLKTELNSRVITGAIVGIIGLLLVFWNEFAKTFHDHGSMHVLIIAIGYCLLGTYFASLGNILSKRNQQLNMPVLQTNAWGMLYGTCCSVIIALFLHEPITFTLSFSYITALVYLSTFGTVLAFGMYLRLIGCIGPERAAYIFVLTPIVALILSSFFESFQWQFSTLGGIALILLGNLLVMRKPTPTAIKETA